MVKMAQEIQIHRELSYKHVVGFHSYFEDMHYVYIILELCNKRVSFLIFPFHFLVLQKSFLFNTGYTIPIYPHHQNITVECILYFF